MGARSPLPSQSPVAQNAARLSRNQGRTHALRRKLRDLADFVFVDAPHELPPWTKEVQPEAAVEQRGPQAPRRGWLLAPDQLCSSGGCSEAHHPVAAPAFVDASQYQRQTAGWEESERALQAVLWERGPFDGVLALSQGAAVAAVFVIQQWRQQQQQHAVQSQASQAAPGAQPPLRFAILCSGYRSAVREHQQLLADAAAAGGCPIPSLHVFGKTGKSILSCLQMHGVALRACSQRHAATRHQSRRPSVPCRQRRPADQRGREQSAGGLLRCAAGVPGASRRCSLQQPAAAAAA